jgi:hypothetical protein
MHSASLIAACSLSLALAACAVDAGRREPEQSPRRANPAPAEPRRENSPPPAPVAPLQRQPAPARIPYQLILPPPLPAPPPVPAPVGPQTPVPLTTCDFGGCWNSGAGRYNGGTGDTFLDRGGHQCVRNGAWMQCF